MRKHCLSAIALLVMVVLAAGSVDTGTNGTSTSRPRSSVPSTPSSSTQTTKWYEGGTLHSKSALEWQTASAADKLATCSDFVTKMWQNGDLNPSIANNLSTVDDVRPYAQELVTFLDAAFERDPDPEQNRILFTNQTVAYFAALGMFTMGWTIEEGAAKEATRRVPPEEPKKLDSPSSGIPETVTPPPDRVLPSFKQRVFTDVSGQFNVLATLVSFADGRVTLRRANNGEEVSMPLEQLSEFDQKYILAVTNK